MSCWPAMRAVALIGVAACGPEPRPTGVPDVAVEPSEPSPAGSLDLGVREASAPPPAEATPSLEVCPLDVANAIDMNGDGQPDVYEVVVKGVVRCRATDFDFDGRPDQTVFLDEQGNKRSEMRDLDGDGSPDVRKKWTDGRCTEERDTDGDGAFDLVRPC